MPAAAPALTGDEARDFVAARGFGRDESSPRPGRHLGIELEWLAVSLSDPSRPAPFRVVQDVADGLDHLPGGSRLSFEPGGQVELSSPPLPLGRACETLAGDAEVLGDALLRAGVGLVALGLEPGPCRERVVRSPRYDAMEAYFDSEGPAGRTMMRSTAALQVNLDLGDGAEVDRRWRAAHDLAPVLAAAFANSPMGAEGPTGWRSSRLAVWAAIDPSRTAPADGTNGDRGCDAWADYALAARVMLVRAADGRHEPVLAHLPFARWLDCGHELGWPTVDDLDYHLTTLFPPVRPRGWLELRVIDAVPGPWWRVAAAVTAVLVQDPALADVVAREAAPTRGLWSEAARDGLAHPALGRAAGSCFAAALDALPRSGADRPTIEAAVEYTDRYVERGRCPADDLLEQWASRGVAMPRPDNCAEPAWR